MHKPLSGKNGSEENLSSFIVFHSSDSRKFLENLARSSHASAIRVKDISRAAWTAIENKASINAARDIYNLLAIDPPSNTH